MTYNNASLATPLNRPQAIVFDLWYTLICPGAPSNAGRAIDHSDPGWLTLMFVSAFCPIRGRN